MRRRRQTDSRSHASKRQAVQVPEIQRIHDWLDRYLPRVLISEVVDWLRPLPPDARATIHLMRFSKRNNVDDIAHLLRDGDIVENTDVSGHRTEGLLVVCKRGPHTDLRYLECMYDMYGHMPEMFRVFEVFPPNYWCLPECDVVRHDGTEACAQSAYWHHETQGGLVPFGQPPVSDALIIKPQATSVSYWGYTYAKGEYFLVADIDLTKQTAWGAWTGDEIRFDARSNNTTS